MDGGSIDSGRNHPYHPYVDTAVKRTRVASVMHCVIHTSAPDAVLCV